MRANGRLQRAARAHSRTMVQRRFFAHVGPGTLNPAARLRSTRYLPGRGRWAIGENIGFGTGALTRPIAIHSAWMHSTPHRAAMLSPRFREVGFGVYPGSPYLSPRGHVHGRLRREPLIRADHGKFRAAICCIVATSGVIARSVLRWAVLAGDSHNLGGTQHGCWEDGQGCLRRHRTGHTVRDHGRRTGRSEGRVHAARQRHRGPPGRPARTGHRSTGAGHRHGRGLRPR